MILRILSLLLGVCLATIPCLAKAQTVFNDGRTHSVNGASGAIFVENGSTLNIESPAAVSGSSAVLSGTAVYGDGSSAINLTGGHVYGAVSPSVYGQAAISADGSFSASGGSAIGANSTIVMSEAGAGLLTGVMTYFWWVFYWR